MTHYIIIGNGIAGSTAAETLRENDKECEITLIGQEKYPLYSRMNLEYYVSGDSDKEHMILKSKDWYKKMDIDLKLNTKVTRLNPRGNYVKLEDGTRLRFDKLLIASGGRPKKLEVAGSNLKRIHYFQTLKDADDIIKSVSKSKKAVIIGGGFIGADSAVALRRRNLEVDFLIREGRYWYKFLDEKASKIIHKIMEENDVRLLFGEEAVEFIGKNGTVSRVYTTKGRYLDADMVIIGVGINRNLEFLDDTDIKIRRGIVINKYLQTTKYPHIFAAGDVAEFYDIYVDQWMTHGNWMNASQQGEVAALNMLGKKEVFDDVSQYNADLFGTCLCAIGDVEIDTKEFFVEFDEKKSLYRKAYMKDGKIVGAILIGDISSAGKMRRMITEKIEVKKKKDIFGD